MNGNSSNEYEKITEANEASVKPCIDRVSHRLKTSVERATAKDERAEARSPRTSIFFRPV